MNFKEYCDNVLNENLLIEANVYKKGDQVEYKRSHNIFKGSVIHVDKDRKYLEVRNSVGDIDYISKYQILKHDDGTGMKPVKHNHKWKNLPIM